MAESGDQRAWSDYRRVEACVLFAVNRWIVLVVVVMFCHYYVRPVSELLDTILVIVAFVIQQAWARRDDARRREAAGSR